MPRTGRVLIVGVGNEYRGDDGVGIEVARRIAPLGRDDITILETPGDVASVIDAWQQYDWVAVVDATRSGATPGSIMRFDPAISPIPSVFVSHVSSHGVGVGEAVALADALDQLPHRLVVWGIEGLTFETGIGLSPAVAASVSTVVTDILAEIDAESGEKDSHA